jgi:hypothetical protein
MKRRAFITSLTEFHSFPPSFLFHLPQNHRLSLKCTGDNAISIENHQHPVPRRHFWHNGTVKRRTIPGRRWSPSKWSPTQKLKARGGHVPSEARKSGGETHKYHYKLYIIILLYMIVLRYRPTMRTGYADAPRPPENRLNLRPTEPTTNAFFFSPPNPPKINIRLEKRQMAAQWRLRSKEPS